MKMPRPPKPAMVTMIALGTPKKKDEEVMESRGKGGGKSMALRAAAAPSGEIPLEAVGFRSEEQVCGNCAHYGQGGGCAILPHAPCTPGASCAAWKAGESEQYQDAEEPVEDEGGE